LNVKQVFYYLPVSFSETFNTTHNYRTIFVNAIASEFLILLQQINLLKIVHQPHKIHYKTIRFPAMKSISMIRAW